MGGWSVGEGANNRRDSKSQYGAVKGNNSRCLCGQSEKRSPGSLHGD